MKQLSPAAKAEYEGGMTLAQIAARHGMSVVTVVKKLRSMRAEIRGKGAPSKQHLFHRTVALDYLDGRTLKEISAQFDCCEDTVRKYLLENSITLRGQGTMKRGRPAPWCRKIETSRLVEIPILRAKGYSLQKIGDEMGVTRERIRQVLIELSP